MEQKEMMNLMLMDAKRRKRRIIARRKTLLLLIIWLLASIAFLLNPEPPAKNFWVEAFGTSLDPVQQQHETSSPPR